MQGFSRDLIHSFNRSPKKNFSLLVPSLGFRERNLLTGFVMIITGSLMHRGELEQIIRPWGSDNIDKQVRKGDARTLYSPH